MTEKFSFQALKKSMHMLPVIQYNNIQKISKISLIEVTEDELFF